MRGDGMPRRTSRADAEGLAPAGFTAGAASMPTNRCRRATRVNRMLAADVECD
jgi:hypothetical protein